MSIVFACQVVAAAVLGAKNSCFATIAISLFTSSFALANLQRLRALVILLDIILSLRVFLQKGRGIFGLDLFYLRLSFIFELLYILTAVEVAVCTIVIQAKAWAVSLNTS